MGIFNIVETSIATIIGGLVVALIIGNLNGEYDYPNFPDFDQNINFILIGIIIVITIIGILYAKKRKGKWYAVSTSDFNDYKNYFEIGKLDHAKVKWIIGMPYQTCDNPQQIKVKIPPRCPKCLTELEQDKSSIKGYDWKCPRCQFKTRNNKSYWDVRKSVEKIARRHWEETREK